MAAVPRYVGYTAGDPAGTSAGRDCRTTHPNVTTQDVRVRSTRKASHGRTVPIAIIAAIIVVAVWWVKTRKPLMTENVYGQPRQKWGDPTNIPKHLSEPAEQIPPSDVLRETDRCDWARCGARAYVRVYFIGGHSIDACKHHADLNWSMIERIAADVVYERYKLERAVEK